MKPANQFVKWIVTLPILLSLICFSSCREKSSAKADEGPSPEQSPEDELSSFQIPAGLKVQLVAAEPMVQDPVLMTFDENGRLWVVEMRGFMPDIDGKGEDQKVGRISVLEDTNHDGEMDKSTVYIDSLVLPRAVAPIAGGALVADNSSLWLTQDKNADLKADSKILIDPDYAGSKLPEHAGNGLWRGLDNWYYNVKSRFRYKLIEGKWTRDSTEFRGQWGISHDDKGRLYYNYNWSQLHADLVPPNYLSRNKNHSPTSGIDHGLTIDRRVYPIRPNPAVNRGYIPGTLSNEGKLMEFTAACSPLYYRGTALPKEYYGNVFVCEPSGNLVKRNVVKENGFLLSAFDPNPGKEFFASTDERFRPVHTASGPDGALYVVDMYRGLIQHGAYVTPYLREQTLTRKLAQPIHRGRIWRIVPDSWKPEKLPLLSDASTEQLINYLSHENGWYRDIAQRLLVERRDKSAGPQLQSVALSGTNSFGRVHALWTLEGLGILEPDLLFKIIDDKNSFVSSNAIRLLESFAREDKFVRQRLEVALESSMKAAEPDKLLQIILTSGSLSKEFKLKNLPNVIQQHDTSALLRDAVMSSIGDQEFDFLSTLQKSHLWEKQSSSHEIFIEMLSTAIVRKHDEHEIRKLIACLGTVKPFGWKENSIITAMSIQGSNGKTKPVRLSSEPSLFKRTDIAQKNRLERLAVMLEWPGHKAKPVVSSEKLLTEKDLQQFATGRQKYLTSCAGCHGSDGEGLSRFAPPLVGSDWVLGDEKRLALIVLHGIEGPIEISGKKYDQPEILPVMPSHSTMDDGSITAILTYIRNEWGNNAGPMTARTVGATRHTSQGRVVPWTASELNQYIIDTKDVNAKKQD